MSFHIFTCTLNLAQPTMWFEATFARRAHGQATVKSYHLHGENSVPLQASATSSEVLGIITQKSQLKEAALVMKSAVRISAIEF